MSPVRKRLITLKILLTLILILFISFSPLKSHAAISGLWHFDQGAGQTIVDSSGNGNNGALKYITNPLCTDADGPDWTTGKLNTGIRFDGCNDYARILFSNTLDILNGGPFAFTIWFKVDMLPSVTDRHYILFQQLDGTMPGSGKHWLYINKNNDVIGTALGGTHLSSGVKVIADTWYLVTLNYDDTDLSLYINIDFKGSPSATTIVISDGDYLLGAFKKRYNPFWFNGTIDEGKIYDRALTPDEIANEYIEGPPLPPPDLEADSVVELSWSPNSEPDLAGYNIYRFTTSGQDYTKVNTAPIITPSYTDTSVINGIAYYYIVTAVDTSLNESEYMVVIGQKF